MGYKEAEMKIRGAIQEFYNRNKRVPRNIEELSLQIPVADSFRYFGDNVYYYAWEADKFALRFPERDGLIFTNDDFTLFYKDIIYEK